MLLDDVHLFKYRASQCWIFNINVWAIGLVLQARIWKRSLFIKTSTNWYLTWVYTSEGEEIFLSKALCKAFIVSLRLQYCRGCLPRVSLKIKCKNYMNIWIWIVLMYLKLTLALKMSRGELSLRPSNLPQVIAIKSEESPGLLLQTCFKTKVLNTFV